MPPPADPPIDIPPAWQRLPIEDLRGTLMVIGAPDTGKSTFARYVYQRVCRAGRRVAFLDGDPGQSVLGPPTTMTVALGQAAHDHFPPRGPRGRWFVGATSPRGHLLQAVVGSSRLLEVAKASGVEVVVFDTSGFVDAAGGGIALKMAKIELLRPAAVFALARGQELDRLLTPLDYWPQMRLFRLQPSTAVQARDQATRQAARAARFAAYFARAQAQVIRWAHLAVLPAAHFTAQRLVALQDRDGLARSLGIVLEDDPAARAVTLLARPIDQRGITTLRLGDTFVDPVTLRDRTVMPGNA